MFDWKKLAGYWQLILAFLLEELIITGIGNTHRGVGHESGWIPVRLQEHGGNHAYTFVLATIVLILLAFALIELITEVKIVGVLLLLALVVYWELLHHHDLPNPQNNWIVIVAWTLGVLMAVYKIMTKPVLRALLAGAKRFGISTT